MRGSSWLFALALASSAIAPSARAAVCYVADTRFTIADDGQNNGFPPQIVIWVEDKAGNFIDTLYITQKTGTYGIGNRPGREDFNSGPLWPYGRREQTFPVWAHRHGLEFPRLVYQDYVAMPCTSDAQCGAYKCDPINHECAQSQDTDLSHSRTNSSTEYHFCRPLISTETKWRTAIDAGTCASNAYTDKGTFSSSVTSLYPPRADLHGQPEDSPDSLTYEMINPFDAVSQATPQAGAATDVLWAMPPDLIPGDYVMFAEVSKEFDFNTTYNATTYPSPDLPFYGEYGLPARGQPSVIYAVPFSVTDQTTSALTLAYVGYGDPEGQDGAIRPPDATIDETSGTGAGRFALTSNGIDMFRMRVGVERKVDNTLPGKPFQPRAQNVDTARADVSFLESGGDGVIGTVRGYEIRYLANDVITDENFASGMPINTAIKPESVGALQQFPLENLLPITQYSVGIRAYDDCHNVGPLAVVTFTTEDRKSGQVDACFIATAAYGSLLAKEVSPLRRFRDQVLRHTAFGELAVETYYTFGPALAGTISESELLRATARDLLDPIVRIARRFE